MTRIMAGWRNKHMWIMRISMKIKWDASQNHLQCVAYNGEHPRCSTTSEMCFSSWRKATGKPGLKSLCWKGTSKHDFTNHSPPSESSLNNFTFAFKWNTIFLLKLQRAFSMTFLTTMCNHRTLMEIKEQKQGNERTKNGLISSGKTEQKILFLKCECWGEIASARQPILIVTKWCDVESRVVLIKVDHLSSLHIRRQRDSDCDSNWSKLPLHFNGCFFP